MKACALLIACLASAIIGPTVTGTVEKIDKDQLQLKTSDGIVTLHVDERTIIRKGRITNDLSVLTVGDEIRATCYGQGIPIAADISAQVKFSGTVTEASPVHMKIIRDSATAAAATEKKSTVFVYLEPATRFGASPKRLLVGARVNVVGWDAGDGVVDAEKVAIYDTDVPMRPPARPPK